MHPSLWYEKTLFVYLEFWKLALRVNQDVIEEKLLALNDKYFGGDGVTGTFEKFHLQPLDQVHLNQSYDYENHDKTDGRMVGILMLIDLFILVMAW